MDMISRQAAIEPKAISEWKKEFREYVDSLDITRDDWKGIIEYIDEIPSAQPEHTETHSCDCECTETHDLISREAAIDAVKQHMNNVSGGTDEYYIAHLHIIELLQIVPTAEPESHRAWYMHGYRDEQRWIPVTERLPEDNEEVLTTYIVNGNKNKRYTETATYYDDDEGDWLSPWDEYREAGARIEVIAWMPLPEPYKGGTR